VSTKTWLSDVSGNWNVGANWSPGSVPGPSDEVTIGSVGNTGSFTVTDDSTATITSLTLAGAGSAPTRLVIDQPATLTATAFATADANSTISGDGTLIANGATIGGGFLVSLATVQLTGGSLTVPAGFAIGSGITLVGFGTIDASITSANGTILASGGTLTVTGDLGPDVNPEIASASTLSLLGSTSAGDTVSFSNDKGNSGTLLLGEDVARGSFENSGTIANMFISTGGAVPTDVIDLAGVDADGYDASEIVNGDTIRLSSGGIAVDQFTLASAVGAGTFVDWAPDGSGGTDVFLSDMTNRITWIADSGDWGDSGNWSPSLPAAGDVVLINRPGTYTVAAKVDISAANALAALTLDNADATLELDGTLTASTTIEINAGTLTGTGTLAAPGIVNRGSISIGPGLPGGTLTIEGDTFTNSDGASIVVGSGSTLQIASTVTLTNAGSLTIDGTLINSGVIIGLVDGITGTGTITNIGTITGLSGDGVMLTSGGFVANSGASSKISGDRAGVFVTGGIGTVTNDGTINGGAGDALQQVHYGIILYAGGQVTNSTSAAISGGVAGVALRGAGTVTNDGTITGGTSKSAASYGVSLYSGSLVTNTTSGTISGGGYGVISIAGTSLGAPGTVTNQGTIAGTAYDGIYLKEGGAVTNGSALSDISGGRDGVQIGGGTGAVTNQGAMVGSHYGIGLRAGGIVTNNAAGAVVGGYDGVVIFGDSGAVANDGTITATNNIGVYLQPGGQVTNSASGTIAGGAWGVFIYGADGTVENSGTIRNLGSDSPNPFSEAGVYLRAGGLVTNLAAASISAEAFGVFVAAAVGTVANAGTITSTNTIGVYLGAGGEVTNSDAKSGILGADKGVVIYNGPGTVTNAGSIIATNAAANGIGVDLAGGVANGLVTNSGTILGGYLGVFIREAGGTVANHGIVAATNSDSAVANQDVGAYLYAGGLVTNIGSTSAISGMDDGVFVHGVPGGGPGTVTNDGTIQGTGAAGIGVQFHDNGGTYNNAVIDSGTIIGNSGTAVQFDAGNDLLKLLPGAGFAGTVDGGAGTNTLELAGSAAGTISGLGTDFISFSSIAVDSGADWLLDGDNAIAPSATLSNSGKIALAGGILDAEDGIIVNDGSLAGSGTVMGALSGTGAVIASAGLLELTSDFAGAGPAAHIDASGTLQLDGTVAAARTFFFDSSDSGVLAYDNPAKFDDEFIVGLNVGASDAPATNFIDYKQAGLTVVSGGTGSGTGGDITLRDGTTLHLSGITNSPGTWLAETRSDDVVGTQLFLSAAAPCFVVGTRILTPSGDVPIETLAVGDLVVVRSGEARPIKWIGRRSYDGHFLAGNDDVLPIRFAANSLADGVPRRDLDVSPKHAMFIDDALVPAELLVNDVSIHRLKDVEAVAYIHLELDSHDVILAEGAYSETFVDCDSRGMFLNAADYASRYPDDPGLAWQFCAPRLEAASAGLVRILMRLAERSGLAQVFGPPEALLGNIEWCDRAGLRGWAFDPAQPKQRVRLEILYDGEVIGHVAADRHRLDLEDAGYLGDGHCSFNFTHAIDLDFSSSHAIEIRRAADGAPLPGSPVRIPAATSFDAACRDGFARMMCDVAQTATRPSDLDQTVGYLMTQAETLLVARARLEAGTRGDVFNLHDRWGGLLPTAAVRSAAPELRPRALFVDQQFPAARHNGGDCAALDHMRALTRIGFEVDFVASHDLGDADGRADALAALGVTPLLAPWYGSVEEVLRRNTGRMDVVYLHRAEVAAAYGKLVRRHCPDAQLVYSVADLHHLRLARQGVAERRPELTRLARQLQLEELTAARLADVVITHSSAEAALLRAQLPGVAVAVVPWSVPLRRSPPDFAERDGITFIGHFGHAPNDDAVHWLAAEILPLVLREAPEIGFRVVGSGMQALGRLARPGLEVVGHVETLDTVFDKTRLTVAPLRYGAGLKAKVIESLAAGVPCVGTAIAFEGMNLPPALAECVGDTPEALAAALIRLYRNEAAHAAVAAAGQRHARANYGEAFVDAMMRRALAPTLRRWAGVARAAAAGDDRCGGGMAISLAG
jgi:glycosyltransferase involved in cell wall biosynthesis